MQTDATLLSSSLRINEITSHEDFILKLQIVCGFVLNIDT